MVVVAVAGGVIGRVIVVVMAVVAVCLLVGCLTSQQHASVSQGRICSDNCTCYHTEIEIADQTFYLTQSQYTDTGPFPALTLSRQMLRRVATEVPIFKSLE